MINEELFTDLKQFIKATVSQQTAHLDERIDSLEQRVVGVERCVGEVEQRLGNRIEALDEKLDVIQDAVADTVQDHERRLRRLERKAA